MTFHAAVVVADLHIPQSRSLKDRRAAVRPLVEGLRARFSLSVAEVGHLDKWQRALICYAVVSGTHRHTAEIIDEVERWLWSRPDVEVASIACHWVDEDGVGDGAIDAWGPEHG